MPSWLLHYRREWLGPDLVAGLIVWSVVVPQAAAYTQIAGLPPSAGLVAAPGALLGYALLGTSRTLVVGATTATAAVSAAAVAPLADGDSARFAALSAALALVAAAVFAGAGLLRLGGVMDLVSKPVITGFLFGLGLTVAIGQLPKLFGVESGTGQFFEQLWALLGNLDETHGWTLAVGAASVGLLVAFRRFAPSMPGTLLVLVLAIAASAALDLAGHGVAVVGELPSAVPDPTWPDVSWRDTQLASLVAAGLTVLTGAFLAFLFEDLPEATLGAIVVVAIFGLFRIDELRRFARIRTSAADDPLGRCRGAVSFQERSAVTASRRPFSGRLRSPPRASPAPGRS